MRKNNSLLVKLLSWLLGIVATTVLSIGGAYVYVKIKYDVDLFQTINQVRGLTQAVDENEKLKNKFDDTDMDNAVELINQSFSNLIVKDDDDNYIISSSGVENLHVDLMLTDKHCGAILDNLFLRNSLEENPIKIANIEIPFSFIELDFSDYSMENDSIILTTVFKLDATQAKDKMIGFPANIIKNYIPDYFYIFASATITKLSNPLEFSISDPYISINNLSKEDTMDLLNKLNKIVGFTDTETLADSFCGNIANGLMGSSSENQGLFYIFNNYGAVDFEFVEQTETIYVKIIVENS